MHCGQVITVKLNLCARQVLVEAADASMHRVQFFNPNVLWLNSLREKTGHRNTVTHSTPMLWQSICIECSNSARSYKLNGAISGGELRPKVQLFGGALVKLHAVGK